VTPEEKAARTRPLTLQEWLAQPTAPATRQQAYLVARMVATAAVATEREQAKHRKFHRRLIAALRRLFAPAQVQLDVRQEPIAEDGGTDNGADDPRPAALANGREVTTPDGVKIVDRRRR
jgi:hypothetical protein